VDVEEVSGSWSGIASTTKARPHALARPGNCRRNGRGPR
jgi:hypothetical protein